MQNRPPQPSRRDLLTTTAAAAGALSLAGVAHGQEGRKRFVVPKAPAKSPIPESQPVRVGLIGCGGMGRGHLGSMMKQIADGDENFQVVAACDVNSINLDKAVGTASENQSGVKVDAYASHEDVLAREDIDCVLIATPEHWHAQIAVDAIAAGKDVYCEKPMTISIEEALWMLDTMDANPHMRLQVGTQYMMYEKYIKARELIASGAIGHPTLSQTSYCRNSTRNDPPGEWNYYEIDPNVVPGKTLDWERWLGQKGPREWDTLVYHRWRRYKDFSTGIIGDLLVHMMTPLMYSIDAGWPTKVSAVGGHYIDKEMENHDQVFLNVEFEKEHTMVIAGSTINATGLETIVRGHKANLYLGSNNCELRPEQPYAEDIDPAVHQCTAIDPQPALRLNWLQSVRGRGQNQSPVSFATKIMVVVDLATRAMWEGGTWLYDPKTRTARKA